MQITAKMANAKIIKRRQFLLVLPHSELKGLRRSSFVEMAQL